ncbi:hypothetical protein PSYAR_07439 [Pseudomonas syringae pv. aceris str. M302273]|nr:hypothetical protein PSYAR_07439 [Pseudomonas syringae pv. aceris str. M302273]
MVGGIEEAIEKAKKL